MPFQYYENNEDFAKAERAKDLKEQKTNDGDVKVPLYIIKKNGLTQLRILPAYAPHGRWYREIYEHGFRVNGQYRTYTCRSMTNETCPICEHGLSLRQAGGHENVTASQDFRVKVAFLFNAIVFSDPENKADASKVVVFKTGTMVKKEVLALDQDNEWGNITSLEKGVTITVERSGEGKLNTRYAVRPARDGSNLIQVLAARQIDINSLSLYNLDEVYPPQSYETLKEALAGSQIVKGFQGASVPTGGTTSVAPQSPVFSAPAPSAAPVPSGKETLVGTMATPAPLQATDHLHVGTGRVVVMPGIETASPPPPTVTTASPPPPPTVTTGTGLPTLPPPPPPIKRD